MRNISGFMILVNYAVTSRRLLESYGLGSVVSHVYLSGEEKAIVFGSRNLKSVERNYWQIDGL